ncbi:hypothetical protein [Jannaschia seohaensis]|nr:hypothetical protein [Jannaschia seohaensis]
MKHRNFVLAAIASVLVAAGPAAAATLWNQAPSGSSGIVNHGAPGGTVDYAYILSGVAFSSDVVIDSIQTLNFNTGGFPFPSSVDAVVNIFDQ